MGKHLENHAKIIHNQRTEGGIEPGTPLPFLRLGGGRGGGWGGGFDLINQALGFDLGRKKHLLSQEELQLATLAFVTTVSSEKGRCPSKKHLCPFCGTDFEGSGKHANAPKRAPAKSATRVHAEGNVERNCGP